MPSRVVVVIIIIIIIIIIVFETRFRSFSSLFKALFSADHHHHHPNKATTTIYHINEGRTKKKKERMSFFGIGPSAKLLTVDVTYTNPTRTCVVKSSNHSESTNSMNNIARETLPLITSGALFFFSSSLCCACSSCVILR